MKHSCLFVLISALFVCVLNGCKGNSKLPPGWRSEEPVQADQPAVTSEEVSFADSSTFVISPKANGIRVNLHYKGQTDTLLKDAAALDAFIKARKLETVRPFVLLKVMKDTPVEQTKAILDVLRESDLRDVNFVTAK